MRTLDRIIGHAWVSIAAFALSLPAMAEVTFPARLLEPVADGEDVLASAYYADDGVSFELTTAVADGATAYTRLVIHALDGDREPATIVAPGGRGFDIDHVFLADDASVVVLPLSGAPQRALVVEIASARVLADLAGNDIRQSRGRITVAGGDAALEARLAAIVPRAPWRDALWPLHLDRVDRARAIAAELLETMSGEYVDARARQDINDLLAQTPQAFDAASLAGAWRVRSLQAANDGLYAYPYFAAEVITDADGLALRKTTGSQRRSGRLWPHGDGLSWVFAGAATVNDDPVRLYSRSAGHAGPDEFDSVGRLWPLSRDHLLLILDAEAGSSFEIYELRRKR